MPKPQSTQHQALAVGRDRVLLSDVGVWDAVEEHIHFANGPCRAHALLTIEGEVARITTACPDIVASLNEHAAGAAGRVIDAHTRLRVDDLDERTYDIRWRVELARLFARRIGEELDEVLIRRPEKVGKLEVLVTQWDFLKVLNEVAERVIVKGSLTDLAVEVDVFEHVLQRIHIGIFEGFEGFVQRRADVGLEMAEL